MPRRSAAAVAAELATRQERQPRLEKATGRIAALLNVDPEDVMYDLADNHVSIPVALAEQLLALLPAATDTPPAAPAPQPLATGKDYLNRRFDDCVDKVAANLRDLADDVELTATRAAVYGSRTEAAVRIVQQILSALPTVGVDIALSAAAVADNYTPGS